MVRNVSVLGPVGEEHVTTSLLAHKMGKETTRFSCAVFSTPHIDIRTVSYNPAIECRTLK